MLIDSWDAFSYYCALRAINFTSSSEWFAHFLCLSTQHTSCRPERKMAGTTSITICFYLQIILPKRHQSKKTQQSTAIFVVKMEIQHYLPELGNCSLNQFHNQCHDSLLFAILIDKWKQHLNTLAEEPLKLNLHPWHTLTPHIQNVKSHLPTQMLGDDDKSDKHLSVHTLMHVLQRTDVSTAAVPTLCRYRTSLSLCWQNQLLIIC